MNKSVKIWLIIAASLILIGCIIFVGVMAMLKWDFRKISTVEYETNDYEIAEGFDSISVNTKTADVTFVLSDDGKCKVSCYEQEKMTHSVSVTDGVLTINVVDSRKWYDHITVFSFDSPKITVYLPKAEYASLLIKVSTGDIQIPKEFKLGSINASSSTGDVKCYASALEDVRIKTTTGDICVEGISAGSLDLSVSTGKINVSDVTCEGNVEVDVSTGKAFLTNITCKNIISDGDTGDITLKSVIATQRLCIERDTGDVCLEGCDAAEIFIETDTGDVKGTLLSEKVFIVETDTGSLDVPKSLNGGRCEITSDTGDIIISIKP